MWLTLLCAALLGAPLDRDEARREAARLATEADALMGKAWRRQYHDAADPSLPELGRDAADRYQKALEIWRSLGDDSRVLLATEKLGSVLALAGDEDSLVAFFTKEIAERKARQEITAGLRLISTLGALQRGAGRQEQALRTFEQLASASRAAGDLWWERSALDDIALTLDVLGRKDESDRVHTESRAVSEELHQTLPRRKPTPVNPPAGWLDLPAGPIAVSWRVNDGAPQAQLVNRSPKSIHAFTMGCAQPVRGLVHVTNVVRRALTECDGTIDDRRLPTMARPNEEIAWVFEPLDRTISPWSDEKVVDCPGDTRMIVTSVEFTDRTTWAAEGTDWPRP